MTIRIFAASVSTKPLNDAQMRVFLYIHVTLEICYRKNTLENGIPTPLNKAFQPASARHFLMQIPCANRFN